MILVGAATVRKSINFVIVCNGGKGRRNGSISVSIATSQPRCFTYDRHKPRHGPTAATPKKGRYLLKDVF